MNKRGRRMWESCFSSGERSWGAWWLGPTHLSWAVSFMHLCVFHMNKKLLFFFTSYLFKSSLHPSWGLNSQRGDRESIT